MVRRTNAERIQTEIEEWPQLQDQLLAGTLQPREAEHALKEHWSRSPGCWFSSPGCCSPRVTWDEPLPLRSCRFPPCERRSCETSIKMLSPLDARGGGANTSAAFPPPRSTRSGPSAIGTGRTEGPGQEPGGLSSDPLRFRLRPS